MAEEVVAEQAESKPKSPMIKIILAVVVLLLLVAGTVVEIGRAHV